MPPSGATKFGEEARAWRLLQGEVDTLTDKVGRRQKRRGTGGERHCAVRNMWLHSFMEDIRGREGKRWVDPTRACVERWVPPISSTNQPVEFKTFSSNYSFFNTHLTIPIMTYKKHMMPQINTSP